MITAAESLALSMVYRGVDVLWRWIALALLSTALGPTGLAAAQADVVVGVVVSTDGVDGPAALGAARGAGGASWSLESVRAAAPAPTPPPTEAIAMLREAYLGADFLRCLSATQAPALALEALLARGHRAAAASTSVFGAACALGAEDVGQARRELARAYAAELDVSEALAVTSPDVQAFAEEVRRETVARPRVELEIETRPSGARVTVDGGGASCAPTPCRVALRPGSHQLSVTRLGFRPRSVVELFEEDRALVLALDPAPAELAQSQLAAALAAGLSPDDVTFARAAADAFEARVVAVARRAEGRSHAAVFDRARGRVLARVAASGEGAMETSIRAAILEWRGITEPTPLYEEPVLWVLVAAGVVVAAAASILAYALTRPPERRYDIVFFRR